MTTYHHQDCYRCWGDFVTGERTDHACDCDECVPVPPTEAALAARHEFEMDGGNFHSDGTYHTGDDDGYHGPA